MFEQSLVQNFLTHFGGINLIKKILEDQIEVVIVRIPRDNGKNLWHPDPIWLLIRICLCCSALELLNLCNNLFLRVLVSVYNSLFPFFLLLSNNLALNMHVPLFYGLCSTLNEGHLPAGWLGGLPCLWLSLFAGKHCVLVTQQASVKDVFFFWDHQSTNLLESILEPRYCIHSDRVLRFGQCVSDFRLVDELSCDFFKFLSCAHIWH